MSLQQFFYLLLIISAYFFIFKQCFQSLMFCQHLFSVFVFVPNYNQQRFFFNFKVIFQMVFIKPIEIILYSFGFNSFAESSSYFPADQQSVVMVVAQTL